MGMRTAERLREIAELVDGSSTLGDVMDVLTGRLGVVPDGEGRIVEDLERCLFEIVSMMNDEVAACYLPRPTFDDGKVVKVGDVIDENGEAKVVEGVSVGVIWHDAAVNALKELRYGAFVSRGFKRWQEMAQMKDEAQFEQEHLRRARVRMLGMRNPVAPARPCHTS